MSVMDGGIESMMTEPPRKPTSHDLMLKAEMVFGLFRNQEFKCLKSRYSDIQPGDNVKQEDVIRLLLFVLSNYSIAPPGMRRDNNLKVFKSAIEIELKDAIEHVLDKHGVPFGPTPTGKRF